MDRTSLRPPSAPSRAPKRSRKPLPAAPLPAPAGRRSSKYRGVTRHRWTGRYEAHLWDKEAWNQTQTKKGRQVYLGAYDDEEAAAHAYDLAALKYWGSETVLNFPLSNYVKDIEEMSYVTKEEYLACLRRKSSGFSRGVSKYRGVARHHHNGRWEARIGRIFGNKYLYLGTYSTQEEAAEAYDKAAIEYRGLNAVTNFEISRYVRWLKPHQQLPEKDSSVPNGSSSLSTKHSQDHLVYEYQTNIHTDQHLSSSWSRIGAGQQSSDVYNLQPPPAGDEQNMFPSAPSALGLLFKSSKFQEMREKTVFSTPATDDNSNSSTTDQVESPTLDFQQDEIESVFDVYDLTNQGSPMCTEFNLFQGLNSEYLSQLPPLSLDLAQDPYDQLDGCNNEQRDLIDANIPSRGGCSFAISTYS